MTGEDLDYKPSTVEQERFKHSPMSKFLNKGLEEEDKKEGLLERLKNIEDKNEEHLKVLSTANKVSRAAKIKVIIIMTIKLIFTDFTET